MPISAGVSFFGNNFTEEVGWLSEKSTIEWTNSTWNPVTGCTKISPGCEHCYAETFAERWRGIPGHPYEQGFDLRLWPDRLDLPLTWKNPPVAEDIILTDWITISNPTPVQKDFMISMAISTLPHTHFFTFYSALVDRFVELYCARLTVECHLESESGKHRARRDRLAACHDLEGRIEEFRTVIKKETQFNRQVELNINDKGTGNSVINSDGSIVRIVYK